MCLSIEDDYLRLEVRDNGIGGADLSTGSGLRGLRDRVDALDGHLELDSPPGGGTTVTVEIPVDQAESREAAIERTGGRFAATSNQLVPASPDPNTLPEVAPK